MSATPGNRSHRGLAPVIPLRGRRSTASAGGGTPPAPVYRGLHDDLVRLHEMERLAAAMTNPATRIRLGAVVDEAFARVLDAAFPGPDASQRQGRQGGRGRQGRADAAPRSAASPRALRGS
jgi:hypothetical protein